MSDSAAPPFLDRPPVPDLPYLRATGLLEGRGAGSGLGGAGLFFLDGFFGLFCCDFSGFGGTGLFFVLVLLGLFFFDLSKRLL